MARIAIDEGHFLCESGAVGFGIKVGIKECDITHSVAYLLKADLERHGHAVLVTNGTLNNRTNTANSWGADIFISIHCNAFNGQARGIEVFCYDFNYRNLADYIHNSLLSDNRLYSVNRGVKEGDLHVLRETKMMACLVEMAFIDNSEDIKLLLKYQKEYATAIAKGVQAYYNQPYKGSDTVNKIVLYLGDADVFSAILVSQKLGCPLMKASDYSTSGINAKEIIKIGGQAGDVNRYATSKNTANKYF